MKKTTLIAISIAIVFGAACAAFGLMSPQIWNSPDETAVAFFAERLAATGNLWSLESYNIFGNGLVHPRSIISVDGFLVPGSFYGAMFFFACLFKAIGPIAFSIGTPVLTALASVCVYLAMAKLFGRERGLIGQVLFLSLPAVWYFSSRGLYPNMLFVDLIVIGLAVLFLRPWQTAARGRGNAIMGALIDDMIGIGVLGAAFLVRPVEYIWLAPMLAVWFWFSCRGLKIHRIAIAVLLAVIFVGILLVTNASIYGGPFNLGYTAGSTAPGISVPALSQTSTLPSFITAPRPFILPFGLHPRAAATNLWNYAAVFAWWLPVLALVGVLLTKDKTNRRRFGRMIIWVSAFLGIYYGSGVFVDSSVSQWTIGSSYLRYFLPISILLIPFAAEGVWTLSGYAKKYRLAVTGALLLAVIVLGGWTVYFRSPESLAPMRAELERYKGIKEYVLNETKREDVIVTERSDKIFFPDRRVIMNLREKQTLDALPRFVIFGNLYYFGVTITEAEYPKIQNELHERGLQMGRIKSFGNETLYSITRESK